MFGFTFRLPLPLPSARHTLAVLYLLATLAAIVLAAQAGQRW